LLASGFEAAELSTLQQLNTHQKHITMTNNQLTNEQKRRQAELADEVSREQRVNILARIQVRRADGKCNRTFIP
jgi:hypothetical protein